MRSVHQPRLISKFKVKSWVISIYVWRILIMARPKKTVEENTAVAATTAATTNSTSGMFTPPELEVTTVTVKLTFTNEIYGLTPNDPEMYSKFLAYKAASATHSKDPEKIQKAYDDCFRNEEEEVQNLIVAENLEECIDKGTTIFPKDADGNPCFYDYQWKGFLKEKIKAARADRIWVSDIVNWDSAIDNDVFIRDRMNPIYLPEGGEITLNQRPIRFNGTHGETISAIASSEVIPAGAWTQITFEILHRKGWLPVIKHCLDRGRFAGTGSRRTDRFGTFTYEIVDGTLDCTNADWAKMIAKSKSK